MQQVLLKRHPLPPPQERPDAPGGICLYLSPAWFPIVMGFLEGLSYRGMWQGEAAAQNQAMRDVAMLLAMLRECATPPPPDPESPPKTPDPETAGWAGCEPAGETGLSIVELEELLQMAITKLEWRGNELWVRDGCCDWYRVGTRAATSEGAAGDAGISYSDGPATGATNFGLGGSASGSWAAGENFAEPTPLDGTLYINSETSSLGFTPILPDSVLHPACVKATAIVNLIWAYNLALIDAARERLEDDSNKLIASGLFILSLLLIKFPAAAKVLGVASAGLTQLAMSGPVVYDFIESFMTEERRLNAICQLESKFSAARDFTRQDLHAVYTDLVIAEFGAASEVLELIWSKADFSALVAEAKIQAQGGECGCYAVTNPGEIMPAQPGCVSFRVLGMAAFYGTGPADAPMVSDVPGQNAPYAGAAVGRSLGDGVYASDYRSKSSQTQREALALLIEFDQDVTIDEVVFDVSRGSAFWSLTASIYTYDDNTGNWRQSRHEGISDPGSYEWRVNNSGYVPAGGARVWWLMVFSSSGIPGSRTPFTIADIRITGNAGETGFYELPAGISSCD